VSADERAVGLETGAGHKRQVGVQRVKRRRERLVEGHARSAPLRDAGVELVALYRLDLPDDQRADLRRFLRHRGAAVPVGDEGERDVAVSGRVMGALG
jgi:hypothetical protein